MDEMAIRQNIEFDSSDGKYYGRIDLGNGLDGDNFEMAKEAFVFLVVAINECWKLPIAYFLTASLNSSQKSELITHALSLLHETGVKIVSLTFDGCSTNVTATKLLGCNLNLDNLVTTFMYCNKDVNMPIDIILDAAHMLKLVRNAFGEKKTVFRF